MPLFFKGAVLGILIAAPVGPMSVLCMRRALEHGWIVGLFSGLGVALADGCYAACAAFGIAAVTAAVAALRVPLHVGGGLALCLLGLTMLRGGSGSAGERTSAVSPLHAFLTTFGLTIVNPATIISFAGLYAGAVSFGAGFRAAGAGELVAGTFAGSLAWWVLLTGLVACTRHLLSTKATRTLRVASSSILIVFGIGALATR